MNPEGLIVEARAKIIWGDEPASVRAFLISNGMSASDADRKIQELVTERNREIRKVGVRETSIGAAIIIFVTLTLWYEFEHPSKLFSARQGKAMFYLYFLGLFGIWKLINGLYHLLRPQLDTRSIPDMTE